MTNLKEVKMNLPTIAFAPTVPVNPNINKNLRPSIGVVVTPTIVKEQPTLDALTSLYKEQNRECWLCDKISKKILDGKEISDDDQWHFTSCILSWECVHKH